MRQQPAGPDWSTPRPLDETYWVVPGRLLVGVHPGSRSRAKTMERVRRVLESGITYFIDLTEPGEITSYEPLLPRDGSGGKRVVYQREPILDHGVPVHAEQMQRITALIDAALASDHNIYVHCRAGIGRSATAAGCWLAEQRGDAERALVELEELWQQSAHALHWPHVPETQAQVEFVRSWLGARSTPGREAAVSSAARHEVPASPAQRMLGAWFGLALGDALGTRHRTAVTTVDALHWTQPTAMTLCLAQSLLELEAFDARDQIERYLRWQHEGYCAPGGLPGEPDMTPDVARALASYRWRGQPMAGSHDPQDLAPTSLPRVLAAVSYAARDPITAVALAGECSRTTHQSPIIVDACRWYGAMLLCALQGQPVGTWLRGLCEPAPGGVWDKPLRREVRSRAARKSAPVAMGDTAPNVLQLLALARKTVLEVDDFEEAMAAACRFGHDNAALAAAVTGTLFGMRHGVGRLPAARRATLAAAAQLEAIAQRCIARGVPVSART